jgi:hypothetical protein
VNSQDSSSVRLQVGQRFDTRVDAGTTIRIRSGVVRLTEPLQWLGNVALTPTRLLAEGEEFQVSRNGWLVLEASYGRAEVTQHHQPKAIAAGMDLLLSRIAAAVASLSRNVGLSRR